MPSPGDQYRMVQNPYETRPVSEYTPSELATLQNLLEKQLGPEYISVRAGPGNSKVHYLSGHKAINLANRVFGVNGWSSAIQHVQVDFADEMSSGRFSIGVSAIVRVTIRDGTYHEDIGTGNIDNCKGKAAAYDKAKKQAVTDALKRALRSFGNVLGNCAYDKDYLQKLAKVKAPPVKWDVNNLLRHPDITPVKKEVPAEAEPDIKTVAAQQAVQSAIMTESEEFEEEFGEFMLEEEDFLAPDALRVEPQTMPIKTEQTAKPQGMDPVKAAQPQPPNVHRAQPPNNHKPQPPQRIYGAPQTAPARAPQPQQTGQPPQRPVVGAQPRAQNPAVAGQQPHPKPVTNVDGQQMDANGLPLPSEPPPDAPVGFITGRSWDLHDKSPDPKPPTKPIAFNPHASTSSIRRTGGVDPDRSAPVSRQVQTNAAATNPTAVTPGRTNFINPSADPHRRIGAPSPGGNRGPYRPPTMAGVKRPALADVSNTSLITNQPINSVPDIKKARVDGPNGVAQGDVSNRPQTPKAG
ncbi:recombination protein Rad52 [Piedraia hortae CBS 480.64]|uniref:RAD52 homolog n=1 Tax=Piedraia hortae CBS 480.64 TaxID=1314780 RepID=A0A6A7BQG2_9PEZI|nr:recombination protein Rad52 [Piedraia hortae CBS 480.64]